MTVLCCAVLCYPWKHFVIVLGRGALDLLNSKAPACKDEQSITANAYLNTQIPLDSQLPTHLGHGPSTYDCLSSLHLDLYSIQATQLLADRTPRLPHQR